jgi:hypothetical protein
MRIIFAIQLYFYFVWAYGSENLVEWSLYALLMWVGTYIYINTTGKKERAIGWP